MLVAFPTCLRGNQYLPHCAALTAILSDTDATSVPATDTILAEVCYLDFKITTELPASSHFIVAAVAVLKHKLLTHLCDPADITPILGDGIVHPPAPRTGPFLLVPPQALFDPASVFSRAWMARALAYARARAGMLPVTPTELALVTFLEHQLFLTNPTPSVQDCGAQLARYKWLLTAALASDYANLGRLDWTSHEYPYALVPFPPEIRTSHHFGPVFGSPGEGDVAYTSAALLFQTIRLEEMQFRCSMTTHAVIVATAKLKHQLLAATCSGRPYTPCVLDE